MATKILLALIAAGLWANAIVSFTHPARAGATEEALLDIARSF